MLRTCAVARSACDGSAIRYVLPVLWMTSCFHVIEREWRSEKTCMFPRVRQGGGTDCILLALWSVEMPNWCLTEHTISAICGTIDRANLLMCLCVYIVFV